MRQGRMHLGVFAVGTGNHIAGWRHPGAFKSSNVLTPFVNIARSAERGKLDMVFIADSLICSTDDHPGFMAQLEPLSVLSAVSMVTSHIGLVATCSTTFSEPYNLARTLATLDHISGGRAGWNIVTGVPEYGPNFGRTELHHELRYEIATEFVDVVKGLWDSWEADAVVADVDSGQFVLPDKVHKLNHDGEHFTVRGPLNCMRCPQGQPVLVQAGSSPTGQAFAARYAEVLFTVQQDVDVAGEFYAAVKRQVRTPEQ